MATISSALLEELKRMEGVRQQVYDDVSGMPVASYSAVVGAPTIAMGKKIQDHERNYFERFLAGKSKLQGNELDTVIRDTIVPREKKLTTLIKVPVTQSMFDALFSFMYNTGEYAKSFKAIMEKVNKADYEGAKAGIASGPQSAAGKKLPGLVKRRAAEATLFEKEGMSPTSNLAGYGASYEIELKEPPGATVTVTTAALALGVAAKGLGGAVSGAVLGALVGMVVPGLTASKGAKWGAIINGAGGLVFGAMKAQGVVANAKKVD